MNYAEKVRSRYFRKTIGHPEGAVCHDADCRISYKICTCGLLHDLIRLDFKEVEELYPKFNDEEYEQENALKRLQDRFAVLSDGELEEALAAKEQGVPRWEELIIAAKIEEVHLTIWRVTGKSETVHLSNFPVSGDGTRPDFDDLAVIDCGRTIRFGKYEVAGDAIHENP